MKNLTIIAVALLLTPTVAQSTCHPALSAASDAYSNARKAYKQTDLDSCQRYAKRAFNVASEAESYASYCRCLDAESAASDAYSNARKAYKQTDLDSCQKYAKRAYNAAKESESSALNCGR